MPKNDYGASHWSSDKVWDRRKGGKLSNNEKDAVERVMQVLDEKALDKQEKVLVLTQAIRRVIGLE